MSEETTRRRNIESVRKEAKHWLRQLRGNDADPETRSAHERLRRALSANPNTATHSSTDASHNATQNAATDPRTRVSSTSRANDVPDDPTLRDVQHALARELGFAGWTELKQSLTPANATPHKTLRQFEEKAQALLDAYRLGTPDALERHYNLTWHRRAWPAMRSYIQLDLGKRPAYEGADVEITPDDARYLIAIEHDFESWDDLQEFVENTPPDFAVTGSPVRVQQAHDEHAPTVVSTREWGRVLETLAAYPNCVLEGNGQITDELLAQAANIPHISALRLGNCKTLSDAGIKHLAKLPNLIELDLSHTRLTDDGLKVLHELRALQSLNLVMTSVTDAGMLHLANCHELRSLHLMWTRTGDGAIRALAGKQHFTHFWSGNNVTDDGLRYLREIPAYRTPRDGEIRMGILQPEVAPNQLSLRGGITDRGVQHLRELDGVRVLHLDDVSLSDSASALEPLVALRSLAKLGVDPKDAWMPVIARMSSLRFLGMQDAEISDDGFVALSKSQTIENIWGRRSHGLRSRGFRALSTMPKLRGLSTSLMNVEESALAALPDFPSLRELMPMDVPDAGYRHIAQCERLEQLLLMYCRDTTDAATEHITRLSKLIRYFNSYTEITDRTPELLSSMNSLERITFDACNKLTNAGIASLAKLPNLRELRVSGNALTPDVKLAFSPSVTVHYSH